MVRWLVSLSTHLEHRINFIKMEMEHVPHERPQYPITACLVETELEVLRVQVQVRLQCRQSEQNLLRRVIGKLDSVCTAKEIRCGGRRRSS